MRDYLCEWRKAQGLTQKGVAAALGTTQQYYQMLEAGKRQQRMDIALAEKLSMALNKSFEEVCAAERKWLTGEDKRKPPE